MTKREIQGRQDKPTITISVGAVIFRGDAVLLIRRAKPPFEGQWSIPGGRLEFGETIEQAIHRELREETAITARLTGPIGVFEAIPANVAGFDAHVVMVDHAGEWISGEPVAGDDAAAAEFVPLKEAMQRLAWDETRRALEIAIAQRR